RTEGARLPLPVALGRVALGRGSRSLLARNVPRPSSDTLAEERAMRRSRRPHALLALFLFAPVASAAPLGPAGKGGLDRVPAGAPLVLHVRGVEGPSDRLRAFLQNALPTLPNADREELHKALGLRTLDNLLADGVDGRKLRGVHKDG